ncbi:hypothetical protein Leryth_026351 [Lithospermum erythrorhizon]|nr:hypothetical protein Leryth_026351 [Lithospermum erythrorhizon]
MLGIANNQLEYMVDYSHAQDFVKNNVSKHIYNGGVDIKYIGVGNEPFLTAYKGANVKTIFPALKNIQKALNEAGLGNNIKATIPQNADVYDSGKAGPSQGDFRKDIRPLMYDMMRFLAQNDAPFVVNIYPFLSLYENPDFPIEFAFFDGGSKPVDDNGIEYNNMFDANLDTLVASLKKAGTPNLKIVVGEIGWPTDSTPNANIKMAKRFYDGFLKKMATKKGTPKYPKDIEYYLFSFTDENQKSILPGNFERHWGIFTYDGKPKFPMDFTGSGNQKMPVGAKNVKYLDYKWCALKSDIKDEGKIAEGTTYACRESDCTNVNFGGSCNNLDFRGNASYAFNMLFQMRDQDVEACDFNGMAGIVTSNISVGDCLFPLALESDAARQMIQLSVSMLAGFLVFLALF